MKQCYSIQFLVYSDGKSKHLNKGQYTREVSMANLGVCLCAWVHLLSLEVFSTEYCQLCMGALLCGSPSISVKYMHQKLLYTLHIL